jgi:hypothetical protein
MNYEISVRRGSSNVIFFVFAFFLLLIPPIVASYRTFRFENRRWAESDYGALISSSSEGSDD